METSYYYSNLYMSYKTKMIIDYFRSALNKLKLSGDGVDIQKYIYFYNTETARHRVLAVRPG